MAKIEGDLDPRIRLVEYYPETGLKHVEIPRYLVFTEILKGLAHQGAIYINIAGNPYIQVDILVPKDQKISLPQGYIKLYKLVMPTDQSLD